MRIPRLFVENDLSPGSIIELSRDKTHHMSHVLRMRPGQQLRLFNGAGNEHDSQIVDLTRKKASIAVGETIQIDRESSLKITLCLAISRGQHMDMAIQKAVELGVKSIVPVMSEYSNVKLDQDRIENKMAHWKSIIIHATEQCGRTHLTTIQKPVSFSDYVKTDQDRLRCVLQPGSGQGLSSLKIKEEISLLIGPEGGFSEVEIKQAVDKGFHSVTLGPRILRTETAVISAVSIAQSCWGDLN